MAQGPPPGNHTLRNTEEPGSRSLKSPSLRSDAASATERWVTQASLTLSVLVCMSKDMIRRSQLDTRGTAVSRVFFRARQTSSVLNCSVQPLGAPCVGSVGARLSQCTEQAGHQASGCRTQICPLEAVLGSAAATALSSFHLFARGPPATAALASAPALPFPASLGADPMEACTPDSFLSAQSICH